MFKQRIPLAINALGLSVLLATAHVAADTNDFDKPITVDANSQFIDGKKKTSVFKDNVKIIITYCPTYYSRIMDSFRQ